MKRNLLITLLLGNGLLSFGQWSSDPATNTPVSVGAGEQNYSGAIADGSGGVIVAWESQVESTPATIPATYQTSVYVQKLSSSGTKQWTAEGVKLSDVAQASSSPVIVSDGNGGIIAAWQEDETGTNENIYVQRIDAGGNKLWGNNGIAISNAAGSQTIGGILADGSGGAVVSWIDELAIGSTRIYAQRVNSSGATQWTSTGVLASDNTGDNSGGYIFSDMSGGFVVTWEETIPKTIEQFDGTKIYWQKLNSDGTRQTVSNTQIFDFPVSNVTSTGIQGGAPDGSGGIYLAITTDDNTAATLYLQHVLSNGSKAFGSNQLGIEMDSSIGTVFSGPGTSFVNYSVAIANDNAGGAVLGWSDIRSTQSGYYAQRVDASGTKLWGSTDLTLAPETVSPTGISGIVTNHEGNFVFNIAKGPGDFSQVSLYAQKVTPAGVVQYGTGGVAVTTAAGSKYGEMVATNDKVVFVWSDGREGGTGTLTDVYAQSVFSSGVLPVHFLDFTVKYSNGKAQLNWTTASETNNDYFVVEKSENGADFSSIGIINGAGTRSQISRYSYLDREVSASSSILYYRIKQVDLDGESDYSETKAVKIPSLNSVAAVSYFPNPVKSKLIVDFKKEISSSLSYSLADLAGKVFLNATSTPASGRIEIGMENLSPGIYLLNIYSEGKNFREKIIKD